MAGGKKFFFDFFAAFVYNGTYSTGQTEAPREEMPVPNDERPAGGKNRSFFTHLLERGGIRLSAPNKQRQKLMRKFRKLKKLPSDADTERFSPAPEEGLSEEQVERRFNEFLFNDVNKRYSKSYASIFIGNICTFFNLLCVLVAAALIFARADITQFLFVVIFSANLLIGIVQEILAKKQIDKLAVLLSSTVKVVRGGKESEIPVKEIVLDDIVCLEAGQQVPADCVLLDGNIEVNESLLTGESDSVKKREGETLYAGSFVVSGMCRVRADKVGAATYLNKLTSKAKKYKRPSSEIMNSIRLFIRAIALLIVIVAGLMTWTNWKNLGAEEIDLFDRISGTIQYTSAIVVGMIPSGLLLLTSLAMAVGVRRLGKKQTLVQDLYSLEMLARVNVLCLDKTGTITDGRMTVSDCMILETETEYTVDEVMGSMLSALDDNNQTSIALLDRFGATPVLQPTALLPFSSKRKLSAVTFGQDGTYVMGAPEFVLRPMPARIERIVKQYAQSGLRVLALAHAEGSIEGEAIPAGARAVALITLADNLRPEATETLKWFRDNDVDIRIISGDNPVTVSEVARRAGVPGAGKYISLDGLTDIEVENVAHEYTVFGRVTPEQKAVLVRTLKREGNTVAMTGDGVNDILALKEADCAISVASGSEAARNVSHIVLMNNNFMNLPSVVNEGRRVINNIKNSASLYIMKTLFTAFLAILCVFMQVPYFFTTNNLILFEMFVAAIPSFVIALQPNNNRVKGNFMMYVLSRSVPGAVTLLLCVLAVHLGNVYMTGETFVPVLDEAGNPVYDSAGQIVGTMQPCVGFGSVFKPMLVLSVTFGGIVMLYRILQPLNLLRSLVYFGSLAICIVIMCVPVLGNIVYTGWGNVVFTMQEILYILCIMLAAFPVSGFLTKACDLFNSD